MHGPKFNITSTNISCNQLSDGSASVTTLTANNLLYTWSNGATTQSISGLAAGNYSVTATDSSGCSASKTVTINPSVSIRIDTIQITPLKCFQDTTGNINLTISGGIPPYNYLWSNGSTSASLYNTVAGTYSLTITDAHQCLTDTSIIINQLGTKLENTFVIKDVLCFGENSGAIQTQVTGGTLPYSYEWSNGTTHYYLDNVAAGNYIVSVSDSNGCVLIDSAFVNQPAEDLQVILKTENITCYGDANGSLNLSVTGGTAGYTYQWSNGSVTQNLSQLQSGYYSVIVNDANGCNIMATSFITQPTSPLQMSALKKDVTCNGLNNGSIDLYIEGGTPFYKILWNTGDTTISLNNLSSGKYTTTLTDANGCTAISQSHITEPPLLQTILTTINANCFLSQTGSISLTTAGGIQPYFYLWSNGDTTQNLLNLSMGKYAVTVTDKNNCLINAFASISDTTLFDIIISGDSIICVGDKATLMAPFYSDVQYQWYFNDMILNGANANTFITPAAGSYKLLTKFSCGIDTSNSILVTVRSSDLISISNNFIICPGESVQLLAGGGVDYLWTPKDGLNEVNIPNPVASPLKTTNYSVLMHDEYGCSSEGNVQIAVVCDTLDVPNGFSPNGDGVNDYYVIDGISHYSENVLFVYNRWGNLVYKKSGYDNSWDGTSNVKGIGFGKILLDGTYFFILNFSDNTKPVSSYLLLKR